VEISSDCIEIIGYDARGLAQGFYSLEEKMNSRRAPYLTFGKTEMKAALCFEELAVNVIQFGFPKCKKEPCIDLRLVISEDELVMRLRDNCPMFDVERYIAQQIKDSNDDGDPHLGLKMIASLSENIRYVHSLENNNVILRFERR
jgi:two-component sensor histidine kinase